MPEVSSVCKVLGRFQPELVLGNYRRLDMEKHLCKESTGCVCYSDALEPSEDCPYHGCGEWPPRCGTCGKFISRPVRKIEQIYG